MRAKFPQNAKKQPEVLEGMTLRPVSEVAFDASTQKWYRGNGAEDQSKTFQLTTTTQDHTFSYLS